MWEAPSTCQFLLSLLVPIAVISTLGDRDLGRTQPKRSVLHLYRKNDCSNMQSCHPNTYILIFFGRQPSATVPYRGMRDSKDMLYFTWKMHIFYSLRGDFKRVQNIVLCVKDWLAL